MVSTQSLARSRSEISQPSRADHARRRIIAAARQHFFAHGFRGVSMDDLAAEVGMSKKTLYAHFESKTALTEAILQEKFDELDEELEEITKECSKDIVRGLRELLECVQRQVEEIQPPFVRDVRRETPQLFELVKRRRGAAFNRCFTALLVNGRKAGLVRKDLSLQLAIEVLLGATNAIINPAKLAELKLTPQEAYSTILSVFLDGVLTTKGRRTL